ncbi:hypothetical protein [Amycolatopsis sp. cmx-11-12]|uniref:hypothetical protein n=1 Tax=Amycolatopsis sp. cmx-11-12 TaxID=2785795 RepID=UPI00391815FB
MDDPFSDLVLFPHCDAHVVLDLSAPALVLRVFRRGIDPGNPGRYVLTQVQATYEFFAPYKPPGSRFDGVPTVDPVTGVVTATETGVFLFQAVVGVDHIVGRIQVHRKIENWWFGNQSITTALDGEIAHAQPSIHARFSEDPDGAAELVGDITGHGYVTLSSRNADRVEIAPEGRLRGLRETLPGHAGGTNTPAVVAGTFLGTTRDLPVWVVDYGRVRADLHDYRRPDLEDLEGMQNILLLSEGFFDGDEALFSEMAGDVQYNMFDNPRHEPYGLLTSRFNLFSYFTAWQDRGIANGGRVTDKTVGRIKAGSLIPYGFRVNRDRRRYTMRQLVAAVGLPKRVEDTGDPLDLWGRQSLPGFTASKVDAPLIAAWREHKSAGILSVPDTLFGLILGARLGDRRSGRVPKLEDQVRRPPGDTPGAQLARFIGRVYEFYRMEESRVIGLDPRRHPPEIHANHYTQSSPGNLVLRFAGALRFTGQDGRIYDVGKTWAVDDTSFRRSRGLIGVIVFDDLEGATNMNAGSLMGVTVNTKHVVKVDYGGTADPLERFRDMTTVHTDFPGLADTAVHEFGHSFALSDEYEDIDGDAPEDPKGEELLGDNVTLLGYLRKEIPPSRKLDLAKLKWLDLPRVLVSSRLLENSVAVAGGLQVKVGGSDAAKWDLVRTKALKVDIQNFAPTARGRQLPLKKTLDQRSTGMTVSHVDLTTGTVVLVGGTLSSGPIPVFKAGSAIFVPMLDAQGGRIGVVRKSVLNYLVEHPGPLNRDPDHAHARKDPDVPRTIPGLARLRQPRTMIGIFEGAAHLSGGIYRPAGACKMRSQYDKNADGEFCYVCKWLIVNRVDPRRHDLLSHLFYPEGKND